MNDPDAPVRLQCEPAALYVGKVMHARLKPVPHRFVYRIFMLLIDLDRLGDAGRLSRFFAVERFNLLSFRERDHLPSPEGNSQLAGRARALFAQHQIDVSSCRLLLLCLPRVLGYAFKPISVFYALDSDGQLRGLIYEVRNTFGERHAYVAAAPTAPVPLRHRISKQLHVSPFLPMDMQYQFSVSPPGEFLAFRILEKDGEGPVLSTGFSGKHLKLSTLAALKVFFGLPLMTLKVMLGIHFEAARLYLKGMRIYPHSAKEQNARPESI